MRRIAFARPSCSGRPKNRSYTDAIFSYTPSTKDVSSEMADSERVAASVVAAKSLSSSRGKSSAISPPSWTISDSQLLVSKGLAVEKQVRLADLVEADGGDTLALPYCVPMMMSEEMKARPHSRKHLVDGRFSSIFHARQRKRPRRFMRQEDVDVR